MPVENALKWGFYTIILCVLKKICHYCHYYYIFFNIELSWLVHLKMRPAWAKDNSYIFKKFALFGPGLGHFCPLPAKAEAFEFRPRLRFWFLNRVRLRPYMPILGLALAPQSRLELKRKGKK